MQQPGIEVRPIRHITGSTHFHEVHLDGARTPAAWTVGEKIAQIGYELLGAEGLVAPAESSWESVLGGGAEPDWVDQFLFELASRIAGGTSNIQRNIIGERGLGLPRDPRP